MKVVHGKNLPNKPPVTATLVWYLALDKWGAPGWVWGVAGTLALILWSASIYGMCKQEQTELWKDKAS